MHNAKLFVSCPGVHISLEAAAVAPQAEDPASDSACQCFRGVEGVGQPD